MDGGWGRRTPILIAAAAIILLFVAVTYFLPDSSSEPLDTVDTPEEQIDAPSDAEADDENAVGPVSDRLVESTNANLPSVLADVLDPEVAVTVDGFDFPVGAGFDWLTDESMSSLIDVEITGCDGTGTVRCDTTIDFPFLAGNAVPQVGTIEFDEVDGKIAEYTSTTTNLEEAVEGLSLYRGWAIVNGLEDELFTQLRTIGWDAIAAENHERLAPQFLEDIDVTDDPTRLGNLVSAAVAGGHSATLEELFGGPTFSWDLNGFITSPSPADLISTLAGPTYEEIQQSVFSDCASAGPTSMTCSATVTQRYAPNMPAAEEVITMTLADGFITEWRVETVNLDEYSAGLAGYADWVLEFRPADWNDMFMSETSYQNTPESAALHAELAPLYNETLLG